MNQAIAGAHVDEIARGPGGDPRAVLFRDLPQGIPASHVGPVEVRGDDQDVPRLLHDAVIYGNGTEAAVGGGDDLRLRRGVQGDVDLQEPRVNVRQ